MAAYCSFHNRAPRALRIADQLPPQCEPPRREPPRQSATSAPFVGTSNAESSADSPEPKPGPNPAHCRQPAPVAESYATDVTFSLGRSSAPTAASYATDVTFSPARSPGTSADPRVFFSAMQTDSVFESPKPRPPPPPPVPSARTAASYATDVTSRSAPPARSHAQTTSTGRKPWCLIMEPLSRARQWILLGHPTNIITEL